MTYISKNLLKDEQLIYMGRLAIYKFIPNLLFCCGLLLAYVYLQEIYLVLAACLIFCWFVLKFTSVEFGITDKRVIVKKGVFRLSTVELALENIESVEVDQSFIDRVLSIGTIVVTGTGSQKERIGDVKHPIEFKNTFLNEKSKKK